MVTGAPFDDGPGDGPSVDPAVTVDAIEEVILPTIGDRSPGVLIGVATHGALARVRAIGRTSPDAGDVLGAETPLYVASLAKQVTAALVGLLVDEGRIDLAATARSYLPHLPVGWRRACVRHLVHHTAGLVAVPGLDDDDDGLGSDWWSGATLDQVIARQALVGPDLERAPGMTFRYANGGYRLLAAVIEVVTGTSIAVAARERIFGPAGMAGSAFAVGADIPLRALGSRRLDGRWVPDDRVVAFSGDGGLVTTAADLARWTGVLDGSVAGFDAVSDRLARRGRLDDGTPLQYGWGMSLRTHRGLPIQSHGGRFVGTQAKLVRFPSAGVSIIVLANRDDLDVDALAQDGADRVLDGILDPSAKGWHETHSADGRHHPTA